MDNYGSRYGIPGFTSAVTRRERKRHTRGCRICGARLIEGVSICSGCGWDFEMSHEAIMKKYARRSLWFGFLGIVTTPVFLGIFFGFIGLSYARRIKSTVLIILNLIPIIGVALFMIWMIIFGDVF